MTDKEEWIKLMGPDLPIPEEFAIVKKRKDGSFYVQDSRYYNMNAVRHLKLKLCPNCAVKLKKQGFFSYTYICPECGFQMVT